VATANPEFYGNANGDTELWNPSVSGGFSFDNLGVVGTSWSVQKVWA
jgi:hypothetical protein